MFVHWTYYESPIGWICIAGNGSSVSSLIFQDQAPAKVGLPATD